MSVDRRMAERWLRGLTEPKLTDELRMKRWVPWAEGVRRTEHYGREAMTDGQVLDFIHRLKSGQSAVPRTQALRTLRDIGYASEQKRFADRFAQPVTT